MHTAIAAGDGVVFDVLHMIALPFGAFAVAETVVLPPDNQTRLAKAYQEKLRAAPR